MLADPQPTDTIVTRRKEVLAILERRRARNPWILSYRPEIPFSARRPGLELMVEFDAGCDDDLNWGGLQVDLSMLLRYQVDILTEPTLPEERRDNMLADKRPL
ncbi:MAG TPA: hypothetical protein VMJ30_08660 [Gemmatimonadales bacterium]|nr:hypothetical protein [Gemmatimonadales bacterium]